MTRTITPFTMAGVAILAATAMASAQAAPAQRNVATLSAAATAGDRDAQFALGEAYRMGRGVPVDREAALGWYQRAASQGHQGASDALGLLLFARGDRAAAIPLLEAAADRGDPRALYFLATAHFNGDFAARDWPLAFAQMSRAAASGFPQAKASLITMGRYLLPADRAKADAILAGWANKPKPAPAAPATIAAAKPAPVAPKAAAPAAPAPAPPPGSWRVQLGAYGSAERAEAGWKTLSLKLPALARLQRVVIPSGSVVRLQADGLPGKSEAEALCRDAHAIGTGCFVVNQAR